MPLCMIVHSKIAIESLVNLTQFCPLSMRPVGIQIGPYLAYREMNKIPTLGLRQIKAHFFLNQLIKKISITFPLAMSPSILSSDPLAQMKLSKPSSKASITFFLTHALSFLVY